MVNGQRLTAKAKQTVHASSSLGNSSVTFILLSLKPHLDLRTMLSRFLPLSFLLPLIILSACNTTPENTSAEEEKVASHEFNYAELTIDEIHQAYENGSLSAVHLIEAYLQRIEDLDQAGPQLNSIIQVNPKVLEEAQRLDSIRNEGGSLPALHGIPVVLKDNIDTKYPMATTAGSRALKDSYPLDDSYLVKQLRQAGAIILGKANLSEWANFRGELSSSGWSGLGGQTKNPYDTTRNPCGSSSGSAVAVAAGFTVVAIGTETNGSIVCPSHANGVVGIKPTVGLVSRSGVIPISFTQDTPGPMARNVRDAAIALGSLTGIDSADSKTLASEGNAYLDYTQFLKEDGIAGKRIGLYTAPLGSNYKVDSLMSKAVEFLESQGAEVIEINEIAPAATGQYSFEVMFYEYKDGLNAYFESLGPEAKIKSLEDLIAFNQSDSVELKYFNQRYLELAQEKGSLQDSAYLYALNALARGSQQQGIDRVMDEHNLDAIIAPTGSPAWKTDHISGDSFQLGSSSPAAWAGYPNITVPMGYVAQLPVGISFFGRAWSEPTLLEIAYAYEQGTQHRTAPKLPR